MAGRRRQIRNLIVDELKKINGATSTFDPAYEYNNNLYNNVFKGLKFIDQINDFPSVFVAAGKEFRLYESSDFTNAILPIAIKSYAYTEDAQQFIENLNQDIEHVLYRIQSDPSLGIQDITINSISGDEGLLDPYGIGDMIVGVRYTLES